MVCASVQTQNDKKKLAYASERFCTWCIASYLTLNIGISMKGVMNEGSYMSAHVLLILLNE